MLDSKKMCLKKTGTPYGACLFLSRIHGLSCTIAPGTFLRHQRPEGFPAFRYLNVRKYFEKRIRAYPVFVKWFNAPFFFFQHPGEKTISQPFQLLLCSK